jgi:hypothetical protein
VEGEALRSHPVTRFEEGEEFKTPVGGRNVDFGKGMKG